MRALGVESAIAVNNNAAAVMLVLASLAQGREVIVSRGELVEIGGSFRIPEIMRKSGARLQEIGTTNRTHVDDYRRALGPSTAAILKVHRGNFAMEGFVAETTVRELVVDTALLAFGVVAAALAVGVPRGPPPQGGSVATGSELWSFLVEQREEAS